MKTHFARLAQQKTLSEEQRAVIVGSLLGDGTLLSTTAGWCFRVHHGVRQKGYVDWKYRVLQSLVRTPPRVSGSGYYFRTVTHPAFSDLRARFYAGRTKVVPIAYMTEILSPLALAVWIMDDGSADGNAVRINTQSFTEEENRRLMVVLSRRYGLRATLNRDKNAFRLRIAATDRDNLARLLEPHMLPELRYKIP